MPPGHSDETANYLQLQATALYLEGDTRGDNSALEQSINVWHDVLRYRPRDRVPLDWAEAQRSLGNVLELLGERVGTLRLEEAVIAYRDALKEYTHERAPSNGRERRMISAMLS